MKETSIRRLVICAIFAAICCVTTMVIAIPSFYTKGYVNLGDVAVIITAYTVGGGYGAFAAGLGSALADASMSFYQYVPVTLAIKVPLLVNVIALEYVFHVLPPSRLY